MNGQRVARVHVGVVGRGRGHMLVFYSSELRRYIAQVKDAPNISGYGDTEAKALVDLAKAKKRYIEVLEEDYAYPCNVDD